MQFIIATALSVTLISHVLSPNEAQQTTEQTLNHTSNINHTSEKHLLPCAAAVDTSMRISLVHESEFYVEVVVVDCC